MGREYARLSGEPEEVAQAIFEHYLPRFAGDEVASSRPGLVVGLANRLDSLAGLFVVGLAPSGSADPYHLRRDALGLIHSLIFHRQSFDVTQGLQLAAEALPVAPDEDVLDQTAAYVRGRLRGVLRDDGFAFDVVDAVLSEQLGDDPYRAYLAVGQLSLWVGRESWPQTLAAYSRCVRILRTKPDDLPAGSLDPEGFQETATRALFAAYERVSDNINPDSTVEQLLSAFEHLVAPITDFFDEVLVMAEDKTLMANRLTLLQRIADIPKGIVDLTKLQGF
jgi:glycyl-tRNA synthetase